MLSTGEALISLSQDEDDQASRLYLLRSSMRLKWLLAPHERLDFATEVTAVLQERVCMKLGDAPDEPIECAAHRPNSYDYIGLSK